MAAIGPLQSHDTADVYRQGHLPPQTPDVAGVPIFVIPRFRNIKGNFSAGFSYTHILCVPLNTDVRDNYPNNTNGDMLFVPDQTSVKAFTVNFVTRMRLGGGQDYKQVFCTINTVFPSLEG